MTHFPAFQSLLSVFLLIQIAVGSSIEFKRLNSLLNVLTLKQETTQLEVKQLQDEVEQLRNELHQVKQQLNVSSRIINEMEKNGSGGKNCSCEIAGNLTKELHDIRNNGINHSEIILKMESFSQTWNDEVLQLKKLSSTAKGLILGFRQEKQLRKDFEMKTDTGNDINQTGQSCSLMKNDSSIVEMNSTLYRLLNDVEEIKSSILSNSSNTTRMKDADIRQLYSELNNLKGVIANMSSSKTSTTSSRTTTSSISLTSHLCARTVTDDALILASIKVGTRVVRGRDWSWGNQDGLPPNTGTVEKIDSLPGWVWVRWKNGMSVNYRVGEGSKFDLYICE
ncbi:hypothetical protein ACJMK2_017170 [Sinanodonta woodiana]|uniref:MIB/HERC2 domain-containing protein n=1 Tax=Sinanodonta woodiana TaxID=1069815 RepID=A0ABD3UW18_SINWO